MATWSPPRFNLYGPTPSAAAAQQAPWTDFYTRHNVEEAARAEQNFEQAKRLQLLMEQREREAQDDAARRWYDDANARRKEAIDFAAYGQDLAARRADRAEDLRRFSIGRADTASLRAEQRRQFEVQRELEREKLAVEREKIEPLPTAAEMLDEHENRANAMLAQTRMAQRKEAQDRKGSVLLTPEEELAAAVIRPETAENIRRLLAAQLGNVPSSLRFDEPSGWFTRTPATPAPFTPNPVLSGSPVAAYNWQTRRVTPTTGTAGGTSPAPLSVVPSPFPQFNAPPAASAAPATSRTATAPVLDWNPDDFERRPGAMDWNPDDFERR